MKYSEFHRRAGHSTEECQKLKDEIERLIRRGALGRFVRDQEKDRPNEQRRDPPPGGRQVVSMVETITGTSFSTVNSIIQEEPAQGAAGKLTISFGDEDLKGLLQPHQVLLVVTAEIGDPNFHVKRIPVDSGSSPNVLFMPAILGMRIPREKLQPAARPIYGFDGGPVAVIGTITLPITMGEFSRQATHHVQFVAVDTESPYNAIFGRPLQIAFGAIPSIRHLAMKFTTPAGVKVVRGD